MTAALLLSAARLILVGRLALSLCGGGGWTNCFHAALLLAAQRPHSAIAFTRVAFSDNLNSKLQLDVQEISTRSQRGSTGFSEADPPSVRFMADTQWLTRATANSDVGSLTLS